eukprot:COSAG01_NODE_10775_length_2082_cov_15.495714_3_plen_126_part_00
MVKYNRSSTATAAEATQNKESCAARMSNARRQSVQVQIQEQRELLVVGPDDGATGGTAATGMQELEDLIGAELADAIPKVAVEKLLADIELTAGEALDATKVEPLIVQLDCNDTVTKSTNQERCR